MARGGEEGDERCDGPTGRWVGASVLVALNAVFQVVTFAAPGYFYLQVLPGWLGLEQSTLDVSMLGIAKIVAIFLGIPLVAGYLNRTLGERAKGQEQHRHRHALRSSYADVSDY